MSGIQQQPLCDAGRCSVLLDAIAKQQAGQTDRFADRLAHVIGRVFADFDLDVSDTAVRESVARHIRALLDGAGPAS